MKFKSVALFITLLWVYGCSFAPPTLTNVEISRERYVPILDPIAVSDYNGQIVIFQSIKATKDSNYSNFYYLSEAKSIGYTLYYSSTSMQQPVSSFFWYAFEKAFDIIGITIADTYPLKNVPEIILRILTLSDEEANLQVTLQRNGILLLQKDIHIQQKASPTLEVSALEKRQYAFIDTMVVAILSDPDFKKEFFSDKGVI